MGFKKTFNKVNEKMKSVVEVVADNTVRLTEEEKALAEKADKKDPSANESKDLIKGYIDKISNDVFRNYLTEIKDSYEPMPIIEKNFQYSRLVRAINITKWVVNKSEKSIDKLKNVYNVLSQTECNVALVFQRKMKECFVYLVLSNQKPDADDSDVNSYFERIKFSIEGNFPGTIVNPLEENLGEFVFENISDNNSLIQDECKAESEIKPKRSEVISDLFKIGNISSIAMVTNVATEKSEDFISQGIEKLLDGFVPKKSEEEYTIILLAEPSSSTKIETLKQQYCDLYTALSPYASWTENHTFTEAVSLMKSMSAGINAGYTYTVTAGIPNIAAVSHSVNVGINLNASFAKTNTDSASKGINLTTIMYDVKNTLERIEAQIKRLEECEALGIWKFATYVLSNDYTMANNVANMYRSLTQGNKSYVEKSAINSWNKDLDGNLNIVLSLRNYLAMFCHPKFQLKNLDYVEKYPLVVEGITYISGVEMARAMNMPKSAVVGLPVIECVEFGRNVVYRDTDNNNKGINEIQLGVIHHMQQDEEATSIELDIESLSKHTFITGSTGSGKSTAVKKILYELKKSEKKFLIIEPAKGEYKHFFSDIADVYGTNPQKNKLLKINPFKFPSKEIRVNEHIDRLIEIFNVCWPMYAAMPAVLKDAVERAYISSGWDLNTSNNSTDSNLFPCFIDVLKQLHVVINESDFSQELKSNYTGSLVTRVRSLTNGIYGQIFGCNDIGDDELFDKNVIVDLSRIGSIETKSMIMGIIIMRLQEYRMSSTELNQELKHVTVIEEAHNLLKRTSTEQIAEGSNLVGKSVEMLANAIAEMRTYGEGFIIVDQSPGLLDMSVIRNTNTKIILSLPDLSDRELVGKSIGLNDNQITEITRLQTFVAAVYQNNWISPVLCRIDKSINEKEKRVDTPNEPNEFKIDEVSVKAKIANLILKEVDLESEKIKELKEQIISLNLASASKISILNHLKNHVLLSPKEKMDIINDIYYTDIIKNIFIESEYELSLMSEAGSKINKTQTEYLFQKWSNCLDNSINSIDQETRNIIIAIIIKEIQRNDMKIDKCMEVFNQWRE